MRINNVIKLADFFGISLEELLREQDGPIDTSGSGIQAINSKNSVKEKMLTTLRELQIR